MKKTVQIAAMSTIAVLALAGCGDRGGDDKAKEAAEGRRTDGAVPTAAAPSTTAAPIDFKACMVSDSGGFDDKSFNQTALKGMTDAVALLGVQTAQVESVGDTEYADNLAKLVDEGCQQITTVGFKLGDATAASAKANPKVDYAIVDFAYFSEDGKPTAEKNVKGLVFDTKSASYLAGYVAAAKSESKKVGTFGGLPIPTVTDFMEGFRQGIEAYNADSGEEVELLGWDGTDGQFTEDFEDSSKGQQIGEQLIQQGADVIFPVAGPAGLGGLQAAQDADVRAVWVDTDGCVSAAEYCDVLLTSVMKGMDVAVTAAISDAVNDQFNNELYSGTLENGGVGLAPLSGDVDDELAGKVDELREGLIDGSITLK